MWAGSSSFWELALLPLVADVVVADAFGVLELPMILMTKFRSSEESFSFEDVYGLQRVYVANYMEGSWAML